MYLSTLQCTWTLYSVPKHTTLKPENTIVLCLSKLQCAWANSIVPEHITDYLSPLQNYSALSPQPDRPRLSLPVAQYHCRLCEGGGSLSCQFASDTCPIRLKQVSSNLHNSKVSYLTKAQGLNTECGGRSARVVYIPDLSINTDSSIPVTVR